MANRLLYLKPATRMLPAILVAVAAALFSVSLAWAAEEPIGDYDRRVAWAIFSTIKMDRDAEPPGTEAVIEYKRRGGSVARDGETWAWWDYVRSRVDQKQINWYAEIVRLADDWEPDPEHEARWGQYQVATDPETDTQIFFREATRNEVRHTRVYFRLIRGRVMAKMWIQRAGAESPQEAVDKAIVRWRFFVEQAYEKRVFVTENVFIAALPIPETDFEGQIERNGVVRLVADRNRAVEFPMEIWAEAATLEPDEPYWLKLQLKDELGQPGVRLLDAYGEAVSDVNGDGWLDLWVEGGDTRASVVMLFEPFRLRSDGEIREQMLNQIGQLRVGYVTNPQPDVQGQRTSPMRAAYSSEQPRAAHASRLLKVRDDPAGGDADTAMVLRDVAIERTDWMIIVTRFELLPRDGLIPDPVGPSIEKADEGRRAAIEASRREGAKHYNDVQIAESNLRTNWEKNVLPLVSFRAEEYQPNEKVPLGWRMERYNAQDFWLAVNEPGNPSLAGSFPRGYHPRLVVDIRIDVGQRPLNGSFDGMLSAVDEEAEFRRFITVDDLDIAVRRVAERGIAPGNEAEKALASAIRRPANLPWRDYTVDVDGRRVVGETPEFVYMSRRRPAIHAGVWLDHFFPMPEPEKQEPEPEEQEPGPEGQRRGPPLPREGVEIPYLARVTGIYEVRFKADLYYKSGENRKQVDVVMRYNVMPGDFGVRTLEYTTQRLR